VATDDPDGLVEKIRRGLLDTDAAEQVKKIDRQP